MYPHLINPVSRQMILTHLRPWHRSVTEASPRATPGSPGTSEEITNHQTYDAEKVVSTFLGCFQSNPFQCREDDKLGLDVQIFTISTSIKIGPVSRQNRRLLSFSVGSVYWLMCRVL